MEEKLLEEKLKEVLEDKKVKLEEEKIQINNELSKFEHVIVKDENGKYAKSKEQLELLSYSDKVEKEIKEVEKEKKTLNDFKNVKDNEKALLKAKQDLEKEMKTLEGKYEFRDSKMIKPKELEMYENEYEEVVKKLSINSKKKVKLEKATTKMYEKYGIHQAVKKDIDKAWEEALKENEQRDIDKAWAEAIKENEEREIDKAWKEAIRENRQRDINKYWEKIRKEREQEDINKAWDEALKENEQRDIDKALDEEIKENEQRDIDKKAQEIKDNIFNRFSNQNQSHEETFDILDGEYEEIGEQVKKESELDKSDLKIKIDVRKNAITVLMGNKKETYNLKDMLKTIKKNYIEQFSERGKKLFKTKGMEALIPVVLRDIDEKYNTTRERNFMELTNDFYLDLGDEWGDIKIDFDLRKLYKITNSRVPNICKGKLLNLAKQYQEMGIANVKMGIRTGTVDKIKIIGRKLKNISQEFLFEGKKVQSLDEPEENLEEIEIEENYMDKYKVDNKDNKIEETAKQNIEQAEQNLEEIKEEYTK